MGARDLPQLRKALKSNGAGWHVVRRALFIFKILSLAGHGFAFGTEQFESRNDLRCMMTAMRDMGKFKSGFIIFSCNWNCCGKWHVKCGLVIEKWKFLTTFTRLGPKCRPRDRAKGGNKVEGIITGMNIELNWGGFRKVDIPLILHVLKPREGRRKSPAATNDLISPYHR